MARAKVKKFSVTKAVKANARERVGQPRPSRPLAEGTRPSLAVKHKPSLQQILQESKEQEAR